MPNVVKYIVNKDKVIDKGKTKTIYETSDPGVVAVQNRDDITAGDGAKKDNMEGKGKWATNTTANVFELLEKAGIPTAYMGRLEEDPTIFFSEKVDMIPLEVIARRYAVGSYLKRMPQLQTAEGWPHRFSKLVFELFLKTNDEECVVDDEKIASGLEVDDPLIDDAYGSEWILRHPGIPKWYDDASIGARVDAKKILKDVEVSDIERLTRETFLVLEAAWAQKFGFRLIDFKIEFGLTEYGELVVADVIDNDSWRLKTADWKEISKETFRQGQNMADVSEGYKLVSELSNRLPEIPEQAIVVWRGSEKDSLLDIPDFFGVNNGIVTASAHKQSELVLEHLKTQQALFPQGGVILAIAGMSNGLGPTLAAQIGWPVISVPPGIGNHPEDVWSSLRLPSKTPASTIINPDNAVLQALEVLGLSNPIVAAWRQYQIESL